MAGVWRASYFSQRRREAEHHAAVVQERERVGILRLRIVIRGANRDATLRMTEG